MEPVRAIPPPGAARPARARRARRGASSWLGSCETPDTSSPRIQERLGNGRRAPRAVARAAVLPATARRRGRAGGAAAAASCSAFRSTARGSTSSSARAARRASTSAGLLVHDGEVVHGAARLVPHDELLIASDHAGGGGDARRPRPGRAPPVRRARPPDRSPRRASVRSISAPATGSRRSCSPRTPSTSSRRT